MRYSRDDLGATKENPSNTVLCTPRLSWDDPVALTMYPVSAHTRSVLAHYTRASPYVYGGFSYANSKGPRGMAVLQITCYYIPRSTAHIM